MYLTSKKLFFFHKKVSKLFNLEAIFT